MASSIRLADAGLPETPPPGSARIYIEEYGGRLHLKMLRPDGTIEVFGTLNLPLEVENGGTGTTITPAAGQILIGTGTAYTPGNIVGGNKINVVPIGNTIEINAEVQDFSVNLIAPPEFLVDTQNSLGATTLTLNKVIQQANKIYAGPANGADSEPNFRPLTEDDIPSLSSSKITQFEGRVHESLSSGLEETDEIAFNYDETLAKTSFSLKTTGVTAGTYGSDLQIPVIDIDSKGRITSATTVDAKEAVEDYVGALITSSDTINAEYDDLNSKLYLHVNEETLITTNISETENVKAPTSQAIKQYVDDNVDAERNARILSDTQTQLDIANLQAQILDVTIFARYDNYVISALDIEQGYLVLSHKNVLLESVIAFVNRTPIFQGLDFVTSTNSNDDVILTFTGDILPNQPLALEVGENIRVNYLCKI